MTASGKSPPCAVLRVHVPVPCQVHIRASVPRPPGAPSCRDAGRRLAAWQAGSVTRTSRSSGSARRSPRSSASTSSSATPAAATSRALPLPRREDPVVQRHARPRLLLLLRLRRGRRRHHLRAGRSTTCRSPRRSSGSPPGRHPAPLRAGRHVPAARQQGQRSRLRRGAQGGRGVLRRAARRPPTPRSAREFLAERGFDAGRRRALRRRLRARPSWDALTRHLRGRGFTDEELLTGGLAKRGPARADRPVPRPADLADPRHHRRRDRLRRAQAARRRRRARST